MINEGVDPRDIEWEVDRPVYRVYFWHRPAVRTGTLRSPMGYHCDERRVSGAADVHEVLAWAKAEARLYQSFTLYVEHVQEGSTGLIRLAGEDPTVPD